MLGVWRDAIWAWPRRRRNEVASIRLELLANPGPDEASGEVRAIAAELRRMRSDLTAAFGRPKACGECGRARRLPGGRWPGGYCCGTRTEVLFSHDEIALLRAGGTQPSELRPPWGAHAGCAFRGRSGCSLAPRDRPGVCVRHMCPALVDELKARGDYEAIVAQVARMREAFERFRALR